ncbi:MAG: DUF362 domain-containing protein [Syntrophaceae bacterium]|nr:DUF362 domain-containing protein [Syntrophaceae bacterium]
MNFLFEPVKGKNKPYVESLRQLLRQVQYPFKAGDNVGIKLHWGERGNRGFLPPDYAKEIAAWLINAGTRPFIFDTTVLYSGGRRTAEDSLKTAATHGYTADFLSCPLVIADGMDGRNVISIPAGYKHFKTVQVGNIFEKTQGFVIFSHFKGHMVSLFGGAIKNISMGFASRAQKQRMHSDYHPVLTKNKCTKCGLCVEICPTKAAQISESDYPVYDLKKCIGCAQCIAMCPEMALQIFWNSDMVVFQEKLIETAAAVWKKIKDKTIIVNALLNVSAECDCLPGKNPFIGPDYGFIGGYHPVAVDATSLKTLGADIFEKVHPGIPWRRQFSYAREIGF